MRERERLSRRGLRDRERLYDLQRQQTAASDAKNTQAGSARCAAMSCLLCV